MHSDYVDREWYQRVRAERDKAINERDALRADLDKARALLTAALPHLERFPCVPWDGALLTRVREWLGVGDG